MIELSQDEVWVKHFVDVADEFLKPKVKLIEPPTFWSQILQMVHGAGVKTIATEAIRGESLIKYVKERLEDD